MGTLSPIILEMLENNIKVIHICSEPIYEKHSNKNMEKYYCYEIRRQDFIYKIKKMNTLINFGKKK